MTFRAGSAPLRVEQALRLLPDVDALVPLRAFLVSNARVKRASDPYATFGKRHVYPTDLKDRLPDAVARVAEHLAVLYQAAVDALEAEQAHDTTGAARALMRAGEQEELVGRGDEAHVWYSHALGIAQELRDRRPEIEALRHLGDLETGRGHLDAGARYHQRGLALADAELDQTGAASACAGLAAVAVAQGRWPGAEAWYIRGARYAEKDRLLTARLWMGLSDVARRRGQFESSAEWLGRARPVFEELGELKDRVHVLNASGLLEAERARYQPALAYYREALVHLGRVERLARLELNIRLNICQLYFDYERLPDVEDEARQAEEIAIVHNCTSELARLYVLMGRVCGRQRDDRGFVFFEKAIELSRGRAPDLRLEAEAYMEYGAFRNQLGDREEGRAYLERAREIAEAIGDGQFLSRIDQLLGPDDPL